MKELQKQVLKDVINDQNVNVTSDYDVIHKMKKMMGGRKVLLVLDDVDDIDQLEALAGEANWFKPGSRIIITTRDKQVLIAHRVNFIHDVNLLSNAEAICLFSKYAFWEEIPDEGYEELSEKVAHYAAGLPLTLKVLGSHLYGRKEHEWVDAIQRLKTVPLEKILKRLELSYDGLEDDLKEIFLDFVCILKGEPKDYAIRTLESCGFSAQIGLSVLEQKSLTTISNTIYLNCHDHIEEMGWSIVRRLHPYEPNRHSRLRIQEEIRDILSNDLGTKETKCIKLEYNHLYLANIMKGLRSMRELIFLHVDNTFRMFNGVCEYFPETLQTLYFSGYSFWCLPKTFQPNKLGNLEMPSSCISELWEAGERKVLDKLRFLNLSYSKMTSLDLGMTPNLEELKLNGCDNFVELQFSVECPNLKFLNLCRSKARTLKLGMTPHLEKLNLKECNNLLELQFPIECPKLKVLKLSHSKVSILNLGMVPLLEKLYLQGCNKLEELQFPVECPKLKFLDLSASKVSNLNFGITPRLEKLNLQGCHNIVELNLPIECPNLKIFNLLGSKLRKLNIGFASHLEELDLEQCYEFVELHLPAECPYLRILNLCRSKLRNLNLGMTPHIEKLNLQACNDFVELHILVECPNLRFLDLSASKVSNIDLGMTPHIQQLHLQDCYHLQDVHAPLGCLNNLNYLNLIGFLRFEYFILDDEDTANSISLPELDLTAKSLDICPLHPNSSLPKFQFKCLYDEPLPLSSGNVEKLISFGLCACTDLESFSRTICSLQHLRVLTLKGSIPEVPKDLWHLEILEKLSLSMEKIKHLPNSICMLKRLKCLELKLCWLLEKLPKDLDRLEGLEKLDLTKCISLRDIPNSIYDMKCLTSLLLRYCSLVEKLPEELGRLECLKELHIEFPGVGHLPESIYQSRGLYIIGSRWRLESYGFTSLTEISRYTASCIV